MTQPDFWQNRERSKKISQELAELKQELQNWQEITQELEGLQAGLASGQTQGIEKCYRRLEKKFKKERLKAFFSGQYDKKNALLTISAGAGGTEAQDWTEMLLRMYLRYADRAGFKARVLEIHAGQEAGLKNVTLEITGPYAYGYLKNEAGVHRLVRLSPFNADNLRHTSFALVEVLPEIEKLEKITIRPEDLRVDTFRASGPGGQYVNKTESAVRITHLPTGLVATCQSERLQGANKEKALRLLYSKLYQQELQKQKEQEQKIKSTIKKGKGTAEWGSQIRSYVLHPYKQVKDLRTGITSSEPEKVLDGQLDEFIEAELKK